MLKNVRYALTTAILGAAAFAVSVPANALVITANYNGGAAIQTCADGDACDTNAAVGAITFTGNFGNWVSNVDVGISKPIIGDANTAALDLSVIATSIGASGGETLLVTLTDTGFTSPTGNVNAVSSIGGTWANQVDFQTSLTDANGTQQLTSASFGSLPPGNFQSGSATNVLPPFSLTSSVLLTAGAGTTSGSVDTTLRVAEPGTLAILGFGLAGLGLVRRRRRVTA